MLKIENSYVVNYFGLHIFLSMLFLHLLFIHYVVILWRQDDPTIQNLVQVSILRHHACTGVWKSLLLIKWGFLRKVERLLRRFEGGPREQGEKTDLGFISLYLSKLGLWFMVFICWHQWRGMWPFLTACADMEQEVLNKLSSLLDISFYFNVFLNLNQRALNKWHHKADLYKYLQKLLQELLTVYCDIYQSIRELNHSSQAS